MFSRCELTGIDGWPWSSDGQDDCSWIVDLSSCALAMGISVCLGLISGMIYGLHVALVNRDLGR